MRYMNRLILGILLLFVCASVSWAGSVTVTKVQDPEKLLSEQALRKQAMELGFARAVVAEMQGFAAAPMTPERTEALEQFFLDKAPRYVLGYKIESAVLTEEGLTVQLTVRVNRPVLREKAIGLGIPMTAGTPLPFALHFLGGELAQDDLDTLNNLLILSGVEQQSGAKPELTLERTESGIWKGTLDAGIRVWNTQYPNLEGLWFPLWEKFFKQEKISASDNNQLTLRVAGWFTPDGVYDFDQQIRQWTDAAGDIALEKVDLTPARISAHWVLSPVDEAYLRRLLDEYAPDRGLDYVLGTE
ncbi:MAG: hypothetical protein ACNI27_09410 [Desulfovibrio sp.]